MAMEQLAIGSTLFPKQREFLKAILTYDFVFYGGAVGGGKSWALMVIAGILMDMYPGIAIRAIRESFSSVEQNLIAKFRKIYPEKDKKQRRIYKYNKAKNIITWNNGSELIFDYCANLTDAMGKHGLEQDVLMIDEVVEHFEDEVKYLISRTRSNLLDAKVILTGNPKGPGLNYIRKEFVESTEHGKYYARKIIRSRDKSRTYEKTYCFVEAKLQDNPALMETGYEANVLELPEPLQRALLDGDWYVSLGAFFGNFEEEYHTYKEGSVVIEDYWKKYIALDWGINDYCSIHWYAIDEKGKHYCYREYYQNNRHLEDVAPIIVDLTGDEEIDHGIIPHDLFRKQTTAIRNETGEIVGDTPAEVLGDLLPFPLVRADASKGSRKKGWRATHRMLYLERDEVGNKHARMVISKNCPHLIQQLKTIETDQTDMEEIRKNQEDHAIDDFRYYCYTKFSSERSYVPIERVKVNTPAHTKELIKQKEEAAGEGSIYY